MKILNHKLKLEQTSNVVPKLRMVPYSKNKITGISSQQNLFTAAVWDNP